MFNFFSRLRREPIWDFKGGIHPPEMKSQSSGTPLSEVPLPPQFILPLKQHIGHEGEILVSVGDHVSRGQPLTFGKGKMLPIHAPTSGTVTAIAPHITAHPSALSEIAIFIEPDGQDSWQKMPVITDYQACDRQLIVERIHQAGVAGLGGAGFPTATKVRGGLQGVKTLIINAAECEPYITADDRLMQDCAQEILDGSRILGWLLQSEKIIIGIEDNKPEATRALTQALGAAKDIIIRVIPTKYPSGGAKQLTKILTGREVPKGGRSSDIGVLMQNVGTAYAVKRAVIDGEPLTERVVTLTGENLSHPRNVWGRLGTPVEHLLNFAGFRPQPEQMVIMGGPLMGFTLPALTVPIIKISNCLIAPSQQEMGQPEEEQSCIRCSACADACPAGLLPQQLYWYCQGGDHDKARAYNLNDCIECGACAYVCPSNIPLVQYYRQEKAELLAIDIEAQRTQEAKARFEARQARLEKEKLAREARHAAAKARVTNVEKDQVNAALARVKARQATADEPVSVTTGDTPDNSAVIAQRAARKAKARAYQAEQQAAHSEEDSRQAAVAAAVARAKAKKVQSQSDQEEALVTADDYDSQLNAHSVGVEAVTDSSDAAHNDPRKAAVAAAVARAKAKRAGQAEAADSEPEVTPTDTDPRKAAVAAAIARAKAKRAGQAEVTVNEPEVTPTETDPRKAAVAAAIARAKAKRAGQAEVKGNEPEVAPTETDPRKAAVAAAIARAKAKRAGQAEATANEPEVTPTETDPRKAAVAAAIARAKAKRAGQAEATANEPEVTPPETDPRKAAVAAAIARAKAKRAAQAKETDDKPEVTGGQRSPQTSHPTSVSED
ncbi:electron transport complex subunit RsxC [Tatumella sp. OPLPL6]|uniref:electron transport complex subunit RsxC n=1 Tax=Tatumella sp. OPLPL6 TaxID=1928657 RepID=UPI000C1A1F2A|nr:electron transport complex subunit RsxC [Tatumella sp. OPLPL6]PIJ46705.1 electron transport complex subunit RsxC [Tatumella sp. OPLPL6]